MFDQALLLWECLSDPRYSQAQVILEQKDRSWRSPELASAESVDTATEGARAILHAGGGVPAWNCGEWGRQTSPLQLWELALGKKQGGQGGRCSTFLTSVLTPASPQNRPSKVLSWLWLKPSLLESLPHCP